MPHPSALTPLPVALPLVGAAVLAALRKALSRAAADALGIAFAAAVLVVCALLLRHSLDGASIYWFGNWFPRGSMVLGIGFVVEPVAATLATLASALTLLALIFAWRFVDSGGNHFQPLLLIFLAAMCGFVFTVDLFNLFVFFELMSIAAFALCGLKTAEPAPLQGSFNFAVTNTIAAFLALTGIAFLYAATGALNMMQIGVALGPRHDRLVVFAFTLLVTGFLIKGAIVPFHLWLPDAHAVAPTPVCVLFSAMMVELGLFAVIRLRTMVFGQSFLGHEGGLRVILGTLATLTVLLGGAMCFSEHHLKRMLAFSTVSHAGILLLAIAVDTPLAYAAWLLYVIGHALVKSSLFFTTGIVLHRLRGISERVLFGRGRALPGVALLWFAGGVGLAAAPPFFTGFAEAGLSAAARQAGTHFFTWIAMAGSMLSAAAVFRVGMHTFAGWGARPITDEAAEVGELPETPEHHRRIFPYHAAPPVLCLLAAVTLTFVPTAHNVLRNAMAAFVQQPTMLHVVYTGQPIAGSLPDWSDTLPEAAWRGGITVVLALLLACTSVFRERLTRALRLGAWLESGVPGLRAMQSGHAGDYVLWITIGIALFGSAGYLLLLR